MAPTGVLSPAMPISIATPSRDTPMTYTTTKGLLNEPGQNNCFLNSAVQVLWHLDIFRRSFRDLLGHACMADSCIFCALKELFSQLQFSSESALPPDALRKALAESFSDQQRFQLGFMDDAAECFENMLLRIHMHLAHGESQDMCSAKHCIPHQKFAMTLVEQTVCSSCGATSEPLSYTQMVHYVSTSTLVYQVRNNANRMGFGQLLRKAGNMGDVRVCPSACGAVIQISRTLMNWPEIVSIGLVWNSERPSLEHIMEVFSTIGTTMMLADVFNTVMDKRWTDACTHNLVGVVTYYGKHYSTFFFHTKLRVWIYFDDATVRQVGPHWDQVVEKCRKGRYQPLLLLYASPDGTPVNTDNAPKTITQLYPQKSPTKKQPPQNLLRRSITPSPEKPIIGNTRRAITPNPDVTLNQKPPLPRPYNDYQNLTVIQNNIYNSSQGSDVVDGCFSRKEPEYISRKALDFGVLQKPPIGVHRTLSNGSSSGIEGMSDNQCGSTRRRDSGNWSGDRNSASSSSSTTMENPYLYLVGKVPRPNGNVPESPTMVKSDSSSGSSGIYDAGYDSYSLSSNDSSTMTTIQHMMKIGHLAKIPEDYNNTSPQVSQSCDVLCDEADDLLVKSRQLEDEHDLVLALALCNAAATKARAAMNAPYNNPQTLTLARMKHNTCIMRARSLHRRMTQAPLNSKDNPPEIRHTREGSSGSGRHSRQNSKDKGQHSRQNSRELLIPLAQEKNITKNIEIYATLPKKKDALKNKFDSINIDDSVAFDFTDKAQTPIKESRSIFSRSKQKDTAKREKRSRSEDRSKSKLVEFAPPVQLKDQIAVKEDKEDKKDKDGKTKKQHKIRRKLLMGGLIKRKNRSMPDLTDGNVENEAPPTSCVDDSSVGLKAPENTTGMSGYLSEGHLEFSANPKLKKSKLMRKSFYASAGKILTAAKVPPPPPLRTTSQLTCSNSKSNVTDEVNSPHQRASPIKQFAFNQQEENNRNFGENQSHINSDRDEIDGFHSGYISGTNKLITKADVHQESSKSFQDPGVDEVDCLPNPQLNLDLPPYPSPAGSVIHSRQASEEFPPPPPPLDLSALDEHLPKFSADLKYLTESKLLHDQFMKRPSRIEEFAVQPPSPSTLLAQLQNKRQQIMSESQSQIKPTTSPITGGGDTWLKELQAKQAALKIKRTQSFNSTGATNSGGGDQEPTKKTVKDLTSKFETKPQEVTPQLEPIAPEQIAEEIREVERINATIQESLNVKSSLTEDAKRKGRLGKKKSVSFCDQVVLVATAEDQEDDSYIPNPILERVLRSAINKPETSAIRQEIQSLKEAQSSDSLTNRRNSVDSVLSSTPSVDIPPTAKYTDPNYNQDPQYVSRLYPHQIQPNSNYHAPQNDCYIQRYSPSSPYYTNQSYQANQPHVSQQSTNQYQNHSPNFAPKSPSYSPQTQSRPPYPSNPIQPHLPYPNQTNQPHLQPLSHYSQQPNIRQSPNIVQQNRPVYQHPPSPSPSTTSSNQSIRQNYQPIYNGDYNRNQIYQAMPQQKAINPVYQRVPQPEQHVSYQRIPMRPYEDQSQKPYDPYMRVPPPHDYHQLPPSGRQHPPFKRSVSFENSIEDDVTVAKAVVTPILVNNANNSIPDKTKCSLCRKKIVALSNLYCSDCEYYMSRFKPKT